MCCEFTQILLAVRISVIREFNFISFQLNLLASTMFSKTADWIGEKKIVELKFRGYCQWNNTLDLFFFLQNRPAGELESTSAEYQLLEQMNR